MNCLYTSAACTTWVQEMVSCLDRADAGLDLRSTVAKCQDGALWTTGLVVQVCMDAFYLFVAGLHLQVASPVLTVMVINKLITSLEEERQVYSLMQAAVIDMLTAGKLPGINGRPVTEHLRSQFSRFVKGSMLHCLDDAPKHAPGVYLSIWRSLEVPAEDEGSTGLDPLCKV
jgi:hypothetical protein